LTSLVTFIIFRVEIGERKLSKGTNRKDVKMSEPIKVEAKAEAKEDKAQKRKDKTESKKKERAEVLQQRIKTFTAEVDDSRHELLLGVLTSCKDKSPEELTDTQKTALSFLLLKKGEPIHWKEHIENWNDVVKDSEKMRASPIGDPSYARTHGYPDEKGFSMRRQLHLAQGNRREKRYEGFPLRVVNARVMENTRSHQQDRNRMGDSVRPRQRLLEFSLPEETFEMMHRQRKLLGELKEKFFKA